MRIDPDAIIFIGHTEWYKRVKNVGYVPTDKAPKEAREAMERYNKYHIKKQTA